ncbi:prostatic acid phosphatase [Trichonephila clavata]|uniref:acid phosphatase n=1 Tax=Trichonephila clavata TaxID=2740835 RepID=A0A8X6H0G5_TRICU|nr:prostatic acid phosphatase [Trichonephila clavata]
MGKHVLLLTCLLIVPAIFKNAVYSCSSDELVLVQMISRHCDLSPSRLYPEDPNSAEVWKEGLGEITLKGKFQAYALGCYLRARYGGFVTSDPTEVEVLSASKKHCVLSSQSLITALYAPDPNWEIVQDFPWQPIFVHYGNDTDKYLSQPFCPSADEETQRLSSEQMKKLDNYEDVIYYWKENSGWDFKDLEDIESLYNTVRAEAKYGLNIPSWVQNYWNYMQYLHDLSFALKLKTKDQKRFRGGPLLEVTLDKMKKKASGELEKTKVVHYTTLGNNIAALLSTMDVWNGLEPDSCATVLIELYKSEDSHFVRYLYLNSTTPEREPQQLHLLIVPGCTEYCPLDYILEYTHDRIPQNWEEECLNSLK